MHSECGHWRRIPSGSSGGEIEAQSQARSSQEGAPMSPAPLPPMSKRCLQCGTDFRRQRRRGDLDWRSRKFCSNRCVGLAHAIEVANRFWSKVNKTETCWLWTAAIVQSTGYGRIGTGGRHHMNSAHRVAYEMMVGPIPKGLQIDHLCRVRHCVNPAHMEVVTSAENTRRGYLFRHPPRTPLDRFA